MCVLSVVCAAIAITENEARTVGGKAREDMEELEGRNGRREMTHLCFNFKKLS